MILAFRGHKNKDRTQAFKGFFTAERLPRKPPSRFGRDVLHQGDCLKLPERADRSRKAVFFGTANVCQTLFWIRAAVSG